MNMNIRDRIKLLGEIIGVLEKSDMDRGAIRKAKVALLFNPFVRARVLAAVVDEALANGVAEMAVLEDGTAEIKFNWEGLIRLIEVLIPLIIELIGAFPKSAE